MVFYSIIKRNFCYWLRRVELRKVVIQYLIHRQNIICSLPILLQYLQPYQL